MERLPPGADRLAGTLSRRGSVPAYCTVSMTWSGPAASSCMYCSLVQLYGGFAFLARCLGRDISSAMASCTVCIAISVAWVCCARCAGTLGRWALRAGSGCKRMLGAESAVALAVTWCCCWLQVAKAWQVRLVRRLGVRLQAIGRLRCFRLTGFKGGRSAWLSPCEPLHVQAGRPCFMV